MNDNIYESPDSNLIKAEDLIKNDRPVFLGVFDKTMLYAVAVQVVLAALLSIATALTDPEMRPANLLIGFMVQVFWAFFLIFLIRRIRGNRKISRKHPSVYDTLGLWGYLWRSFVAKYISFLLMIILLALFSMSVRLEAPSISFTILSLGLSVATSIAVIWLFFSSDRAGQFRWVLTIFRGY